MTDISVIIPSNHGHHELMKIVHAVCLQTVKPSEIVIVDSSSERGACPEVVTALCAASNVRLIYSYQAHAFPGQARNIGLELARAELIAFIDVQTIPRPNWLEISSYLINSNDVAGVWGTTCFNADTTFERLVRDGFHGMKTRKTLPGSVFDRKVFAKVGQFVDWVRAGEDTEWMLRLELHRVPVVCPSRALISYVGLIGSDIKRLLTKWYRNYRASRDLPHFSSQRLLLWLILYPLLTLIAFNWNYLIADWRMDSPLYIGHITKIVVVMPVLMYVLVRGLALPFRRGVPIQRLLPIRFFAIALICFLADLVRVLVFSIPKRNQDFYALDHKK
jgi:glycosyltransferase involved in cell wall biosynthesis